MRARYNTVADGYAARPDDYDQPALASLLRIVGDVGGGDALDVACGHGLLARELARREWSVVGVDISDALLAHARAIEAKQPLGITYTLGDASDGSTLDGQKFDLVTSNFGLSDIDDLDGLFSMVAFALRPNGRFVFSILHPCFAGSGSVSGSWPSGSTYYDERWWQADGILSTLRREVGANHRTLSTYLSTAGRHGLHIQRIDEPEPESAWKRNDQTQPPNPSTWSWSAVRAAFNRPDRDRRYHVDAAAIARSGCSTTVALNARITAHLV